MWIARDEAVFNMSKIQIWKRITTLIMFGIKSLMLYLICQRYKFESESQHEEAMKLSSECCI